MSKGDGIAIAFIAFIACLLSFALGYEQGRLKSAAKVDSMIQKMLNDLENRKLFRRDDK